MITIPVHRLHIPTGTDHVEEKSFESLWDAYKHINEWNASNLASGNTGVNMDRLLAVAHALHRTLGNVHASNTSRRFWVDRLYEIGNEDGLSNKDVMERFETFIAVSYWES